MTDKNIHYMLEAQPVVNILNQLKDWVGVILALIKWRVIALVTFTAMVAGLVAGQGTSDHANALSQLFVAGMLAAGGAAALNQYFDRDVDDAMGRTQTAPDPVWKDYATIRVGGWGVDDHSGAGAQLAARKNCHTAHRHCSDRVCVDLYRYGVKDALPGTS